MTLPTGFTPAKPVYLVNDVAARAAGGVALRAVGFTEETALDTGGIESWPRYPIMLIEDADLVANGGAWTLSTDDEILHLFEWDPSQAPALNGAPIPVYLIDGELELWPFSDEFDRTDGALGNGWIAPTWSIAGNKISNNAGSGETELFANPGCEGTYAAGLAPNWGKQGSAVTPSEEGTIIHGGAKAQKAVGAVTSAAGVSPTAVNLTADHLYLFDGWIRNEGPGDVNVKRHSDRLNNIVLVIPSTGGTYKHVVALDIAASSGTETIKATQKDTTTATWYCDDWSLKEQTISKLIAARLYGAGDLVCGVSIDYEGTGAAGVVVSLDDLANPLNYIVAEILASGTVIAMYKVLNGVQSTLVSESETAVTGETLEIRKIGTTYKLYYSGRQIGADATVTDPEIINNCYVGTFGYGASTFDNFYVYPYGYVPDYPVPDYSSYFAAEHYTAGQGIVSLRFDDSDNDQYTVAYPALIARGLKAGFAIVRGEIGASGQVTLAQLLEMQTAGMEIMCHSATHDNPPDWTTFVQETEVALIQMRALGLNVCSFVTPGGWIGSNLIDDISQYGNPTDAFFRHWFKYYTASIDAAHAMYRTLPRQSNLSWGAGYRSLGGFTLAQWKGYVDTCAASGLGMDILFHIQDLDSPGYMTTADFLACLDYLVAAVTAGTAVVKTPTAQIFATPI